MILGAPNPRISLECPTPEYPWSDPCSVQIQSIPGVPTPQCPWSAQPQSSQIRYSYTHIRKLHAAFGALRATAAARLPQSMALVAPSLGGHGEPTWQPLPSRMAVQGHSQSSLRGILRGCHIMYILYHPYIHSHN